MSFFSCVCVSGMTITDSKPRAFRSPSARSRYCRRSLDDRAARLRECRAAQRPSIMQRAARSFTDWPGLMNSALPRMVQPVSFEARRNSISGVRPTAAATLENVLRTACASWTHRLSLNAVAGAYPRLSPPARLPLTLLISAFAKRPNAETRPSAAMPLRGATPAATAMLSDRRPGAIGMRTRASHISCTLSGTPALSRPSISTSSLPNVNSVRVSRLWSSAAPAALCRLQAPVLKSGPIGVAAE